MSSEREYLFKLENHVHRNDADRSCIIGRQRIECSLEESYFEN